jgi:hypothetical protein
VRHPSAQHIIDTERCGQKKKQKLKGIEQHSSAPRVAANRLCFTARVN